MFELSLAAVFLGGILVIIPACGPALLPVFFAYTFREKTKILKATLLFMLGFSLVFIPFGLSLKFFINLIIDSKSTIDLLAGSMLLLFAVLVFFGRGINLNVPAKKNGFGMIVLGAVMGLTIGGCSSPILGSVITLSTTGNGLFGSLIYLVVFELGLFIPLVILALFFDGQTIARSKLLQGRIFKIKILGWSKQLHSTNLISSIVFLVIGLMYLFPALFKKTYAVTLFFQNIFSDLNDALLTAGGLATEMLSFGILVFVFILWFNIHNRNQLSEKAMSKNQRLTIILLVLLVVYLGSLIYNRQSKSTEEAGTNTTNTSTTNTTQQAQGFAELVKSDPGPDGTPDELSAFATKVSAQAVLTNNIEISGCKPNPEIIKIAKSQSITIVNKDDAEHKLTHSKGIDLTIPKNSSASYKISLAQTGMYGFSCDGNLAGMFFITD